MVKKQPPMTNQFNFLGLTQYTLLMSLYDGQTLSALELVNKIVTQLPQHGIPQTHAVTALKGMTDNNWLQCSGPFHDGKRGRGTYKFTITNLGREKADLMAHLMKKVADIKTEPSPINASYGNVWTAQVKTL